MSKGICMTCRNYKQDANGRYCAAGVVDRYSGNREPCGLWKRKRKRKLRGDAE